MSSAFHSPRLNQGTALLLLAAAYLAAWPGTTLALGDPWPITVSVEGEVRQPGAYSLPPNATLSSLVLAAGAATDNADFESAALCRASTRASQKAKLTEATEEIARIVEEAKAADVGNALRPILSFLRELRPNGRVPVRMTFPRLMKNSPHDLRLEEGDALLIPPLTESVTVAGAVHTPSDNVPFIPKAPLKEYIRRAGGYKDDADQNHVHLLRANGTTVLLTPGFLSWNPAAYRWEVTALTGAIPDISPGDTIVVFRALPSGLPRQTARRLRQALVLALEIAGVTGIPPEPPAAAPETTSP
ncbi:MAG: SLBB domain-containing protein [Syntrophorhabdaceae bacterium]|nr:SLBB domain-containing protein [Syntrophorhabdaceae bacterium]